MIGHLASRLGVTLEPTLLDGWRGKSWLRITEDLVRIYLRTKDSCCQLGNSCLPWFSSYRNTKNMWDFPLLWAAGPLTLFLKYLCLHLKRISFLVPAHSSYLLYLPYPAGNNRACQVGIANSYFTWHVLKCPMLASFPALMIFFSLRIWISV